MVRPAVPAARARFPAILGVQHLEDEIAGIRLGIASVFRCSRTTGSRIRAFLRAIGRGILAGPGLIQAPAPVAMSM
jgi:hypothetical protein